MPVENHEGIRMYDRLLAGGFEFLPHTNKERSRKEATELIGLLKVAQVFNIQNVADYLYQYSGKTLDAWKVTDFPRVAPPFQSFFTEFRIQNKYGLAVSDKPEDQPPYAIGILSKAVDYSDTNTPLNLLGKEYNARWLITSAVFLEWRRWQKPDALALFYLPVKSNGEPFVEEGEMWSFMADYEDYLDLRPRGQERREFLSHIVPYYYPMLLALSFLHCKGVTVEQNPPNPKMSRVFQKRHGRPLVTFHTLNVEPMKRIIEGEGQVEKLGLRRALHIVRGHFADYRDRGLFGKHEGLYWFDQHFRGSKQEGLALKDYKIGQIEGDTSLPPTL